jgi:uncharacterized membrane protein (UPF0136 family)
MNPAVVMVLVFGLFSITGGLIGYFKAGSLPSLFAGVISGLILVASSYGIFKGNTFSAVIAILIALLLGGRFIRTIMKNFKVMPDLIMILLSTASIITVIIYLIRK